MRFSREILVFALLICFPSAYAKEKKAKVQTKSPTDAIEVIGHIPLTGGPIRRFLPTQHYSNYYLYAERDAGQNVSLIDVTRAGQPALLGDVALPTSGGSGTIYAVAGTAALVTDGERPSLPGAAAATIRVLNFSDPLHPIVAREFTGVTATSRDEHRGLIFVANGDGIWILHQKFAEDPEIEKAYAHHVLYDR